MFCSPNKIPNNNHVLKVNWWPITVSVLSLRFLPIIRWGIEHLGNSFCYIFLSFAMKVSRDMLIVAGGNLSPLALNDSHGLLERIKRPMVLCQVNFQVNPSTSDEEQMLQSSAVKYN